jgi:hypothetical protein
MIARESSRVLANVLGFGNSIQRRYDDRFARDGAKIGESFDLRIPPRYVVVEGEQLGNVQDSVETSRSLTIRYDHVPLEFTNKQLTLDINSFSNQFLKSACATLANHVDFKGLELAKDIANAAGTYGTTPTAMATYLRAGRVLTSEGVPKGTNNRMIAINSEFEESIIDALKGLFHDDNEVSRQYVEAEMKKAIGFTWLADENVHQLTTGTRDEANTGDHKVNANVSAGSTGIVVKGLSGAGQTVKAGETFTIEGVYAVNPQSRQSTGLLRRFVVLNDATAVSTTASGVTTHRATLSVWPAFVAAGQNQTITKLPEEDDVVNFDGGPSTRSSLGLAYHPDAFALAFVNGEMPGGVDMAIQTSAIDSQEWNVSMQLIRDYDVQAHKLICRLGVYFGWLSARREMACRIFG